MSHWNYRFVRYFDDELNEKILAFCEVHYNDENKPWGFCKTEIYTECSTESDESFVRFVRSAVNQPILDYENHIKGNDPGFYDKEETLSLEEVRNDLGISNDDK